MAQGAQVAKDILDHLLHHWVQVEGLILILLNIYAQILGQEQMWSYMQASVFLGTLDPCTCLGLGSAFITPLNAQDHIRIEKCQASTDIPRKTVSHPSQLV